MKYLIVVVMLLYPVVNGLAFNWGSSVNEGSIVINNGPVVTGNGKRTMQLRTLELFNKVVINVVADIKIVSGEKYALSIETDENLLELISTEVADNELIIRATENYSTSQMMTINMTVPYLKQVKQSGAGIIFLDNVAKETMTIILAGSGTISAKGVTELLHAEIEGSGALNLLGLVANKVDINISGMGEANVHVLDELNVVVKGMGNIVYQGNPKVIHKSITGMGQVIQR